jgi:hypothetical protein
VAFSLQSLHPKEHIKGITGRNTDRAEEDPCNPRLRLIPDERPARVRAPAARKGQDAAGYGESA